MHMVMVIAAGCALLCLFWIIARVSGRRFVQTLPAFLIIWAVLCVVNGWIGVTQAGYSVMEELLVFLPVFGVPAGLAFLLARRG